MYIELDGDNTTIDGKSISKFSTEEIKKILIDEIKKESNRMALIDTLLFLLDYEDYREMMRDTFSE